MYCIIKISTIFSVEYEMKFEKYKRYNKADFILPFWHINYDFFNSCGTIFHNEQLEKSRADRTSWANISKRFTNKLSKLNNLSKWMIQYFVFRSRKSVKIDVEKRRKIMCWSINYIPIHYIRLWWMMPISIKSKLRKSSSTLILNEKQKI